MEPATAREKNRASLRLTLIVLIPLLVTLTGLFFTREPHNSQTVATPTTAPEFVAKNLPGGESHPKRELPFVMLYGDRKSIGQAHHGLLETFYQPMAKILGQENTTIDWSSLVPTVFLDEMAEIGTRTNLPADRWVALEVAELPRGAAVFCAAARATGNTSLIAADLANISATSWNNKPFAVMIRPNKRHAFVSVGRPLHTGVIAGMNDSGLVAVLLDGPIEDKQPGRPLTLVVRDVLERASVVESAQQIIESASVTGTGTILVADSGSKALAIEVTPRLKSPRPPQGHLLLASNAFVAESSPKQEADAAYRTLDNRFRNAPDRLDPETLDNLLAGAVQHASTNPRLVFAPLTRELYVFDVTDSKGRTERVHLSFKDDFDSIRFKP